MTDTPNIALLRLEHKLRDKRTTKELKAAFIVLFDYLDEAYETAEGIQERLREVLGDGKITV